MRRIGRASRRRKPGKTALRSSGGRREENGSTAGGFIDAMHAHRVRAPDISETHEQVSRRAIAE